mmetsp:Transcript_19582/g.59298  ORF Transcript_19582/g.59298 Transcript_19582/m.59298 type:complete len:116 (-) Transcript_19582:298-645(-)
MPPCICIYRREMVSKQLDDMSTYALQESVEVNLRKNTVTLPRICQWYLSDFGRGATEDLLRIVAGYLLGEKKLILEQMLRGMNERPINVKYHAFRWGCRRPQLLQPELLEELLGL